MIYKFIDDKGTFIIKDPQRYNLYLPLTDKDGTLLSSISPNLSGDIKRDNEHFLTVPASVEDLRSNLLCRREFFFKINKKTIRLSFPSRDTLEAGFLYQKVTKNNPLLKIEILNFVPYNLGVEVMRVRVKNKTNKTLDLIPTSFIPLFARAEKNLRDHRHVSSLLNRTKLDKYGIFLKPSMVFDEKSHQLNEVVYFVLGYKQDAIAPEGQFPTLDYFYGEGDLINPDAVEKGILPVSKNLREFDGKDACAAFRFKREKLKAGRELNYFLIMGICDKQADIKNIFRRLNSAQKVAQSFRKTQEYWEQYLKQVGLDFKDKNYNNWLLWVKLQPLLRKLFGCSFLPHFDYGKGGRGWRDLWQDALTLLITEPDKAGELILHSFKGVRVDGSNATIITREGKFISDRNRINRVWMDHGVWPYLTLSLYIHRTADLDILNKEQTYFCDHQQKRAREINTNFSQKDYLLRAKNGGIYKGTILEHVLAQSLVQFFNVGRHNVIRLENADWNDGLDMAPENGESAAFSFMYAHNLRDISCVLKKLKEKKKTITVFKELSFLMDRMGEPVDYQNYKAKQKRLEAYLEKVKHVSGEKTEIQIEGLIRDLEDKAEHLFGWLREKEWLADPGIFNGYYDNQKKRVEGNIKGKMRMMLASQVFAIMSGGATEEQVKKSWVSIRRYLRDKNLQGFRLNTDFESLYLSLGRAFGFAYGEKENGAFFNHMAAMLANALYKRGLAREGFEVIKSIYKMAISPKAKIPPLIPEYFNSQGRGLYLYLTGSASWYIHTLIEEVLGLKFIWGDICLGPKLIAADFVSKSIAAEFYLQGKKVKFIFIKGKSKTSAYHIKKVIMNAREILPRCCRYIITREAIRKSKKKEITVEIYLQ